MVWPVTADPARFDEALEWFNDRVPVTEAQLELLSAAAKRQAFVISGATEARVVTTILTEMAKAVEAKEPMAAFRKRVKAKIRGDWTKAQSARLDATYVTTVQTAYSHGRYAQMTEPEVLESRPLWLYDAVVDNRTTVICLELEGTVRPADDDFWSEHVPPMHMRCRSGIRSLREAVGKRAVNPKTGTKGVTPDAELPKPKIPKGFGRAPDKGKPFAPSKDSMPPEVWKQYQSKQRQLRAAERKREASRKKAT